MSNVLVRPFFASSDENACLHEHSRSTAETEKFISRVG